MLTFAIGDVHGHCAKLKRLLAFCEKHRASARAKYIFLGDYINRGPNSRDVLDLLIRLQREVDDVICLRGNHEAVLLDVIDQVTPLYRLLLIGGDRTLASYGVVRPSALPSSHVDWLKALPLSFDDGLRLFVHAGINPQKPLLAQDPDDVLWIREPFLSDTKRYERLVVHGHTPQMTFRPEVRQNRIAVDTGAGYEGPITAAVFTAEFARPVCFLNSEEELIEI
jgi:serine/threonine protein phosphatase 1